MMEVLLLLTEREGWVIQFDEHASLDHEELWLVLLLV
jgi:hypothetical protein